MQVSQTASLRHVVGFPNVGLLRRLRQLIGHRGHIPLAFTMSLPQFTCWTQTYWLGCRSQSLSLHSASRYGLDGIATLFPSLRSTGIHVQQIIQGEIHICHSSRIRIPPVKLCREWRRFSPQTRFKRFVFLNLPILSLETHLGLTASPHAPFPTGYGTLSMCDRSPPLRLTLPRNRKRAVND